MSRDRGKAKRAPVGARKPAQAVKQPKNRPRRRPPTRGSWRPGQSGNPFGRPRSGFALAEVWRGFLDEPVSLKDGRSRKERLAERLFNLAIRGGSVPAARLMAEYVTGNESEKLLSQLMQRVEELERIIGKEAKSA